MNTWKLFYCVVCEILFVSKDWKGQEEVLGTEKFFGAGKEFWGLCKNSGHYKENYGDYKKFWVL